MTSPVSPVQAVIFDWAGTTVDFGSRAPVRAFVAIFERAGVAITDSEARGPMGRAKRDHITAIVGQPRVALAWERKYGRPPLEADVDRLYRDFLPLQREVLARHAGVIPGVSAVVAECRRRGLKIGGTTGYTRDLMSTLEPLAHADGYAPDVSICADDVPSGRPAPWMLFRAAERLNVFPMSSVVAVDDTTVGIAAGRNAGAWTVGVTRTGNGLGLSPEEVDALEPACLAEQLATIEAELRQAGAQYVIESVADLIPVLDAVNNRLAG